MNYNYSGLVSNVQCKVYSLGIGVPMSYKAVGLSSLMGHSQLLFTALTTQYAVEKYKSSPLKFPWHHICEPKCSDTGTAGACPQAEDTINIITIIKYLISLIYHAVLGSTIVSKVTHWH